VGVFDFLNRSTGEILEECEIQRSKGSGPGGRKADRTETEIQLKHPPTGLTVSCGKTRSQHKNRELAVRKLKQQYAMVKRHRIRLDDLTVPPSLQQYVKNGLRIKKSNPHYPFLVKFVLDVLHSSEERLSETGDCIGASTNELTRFLKDDHTLHERADRIRSENGHHRIK